MFPARIHGLCSFISRCFSVLGVVLVTSLALLAPVLAQEAPMAVQFALRPAAPRSVSGIYPHLAMFNDEGECGTGAVVPWADRLWAITYGPHKTTTSSDKLYEITPDLRQVIRPESVGGTCANRLIHAESKQLFIGPYVVGEKGDVRVIPREAMFGRLTGTARHLTDPENKICFATMEEGFYEVDVKSLAVKQLFADEQKKDGRHADLPGYHGKGFYSGQNRLIYANNGEHGQAAQTDPRTTSGVLAEWDGRSEQWKVIRRNQFCDVSGPGGISGNPNPKTDPVWAIGWDHRSLILMLLDAGVWKTYRLPKASHCYDGAHGWNTEWPRIREIGERDLLLTMHGMFWRFPKTFSAARSAGVAPRSTYLKVVGDFCRYQERIVLGCDDTAASAFLGQRKAKGKLAPAQSQSNLWFLAPDELDHLGPALGRGAVWLEDDVPAETPSDPFALGGFERRAVHLAHRGTAPATFVLEIDRQGNGRWEKAGEWTIPAGGYQWVELQAPAAWARFRSPAPLSKATALFHFSNPDSRSPKPDERFASLAAPGASSLTGGLVRARDKNLRTLQFAAQTKDDRGLRETGYYELDGELKLRRVDDPAAHEYLKQNARSPQAVLSVDAASVLFIDDAGRRWRLPKGDPAHDRTDPLGVGRICREVVTERDLFHAHGTFYELPAENAGGFSKIRPIASHNLYVCDYCSYRGLLVISGVASPLPRASEHVVVSDDGLAALWIGAIDDLWKLGKPRGEGGPWSRTRAEANVPSDPFLMTGYDRKTLNLSHEEQGSVDIRVEVDVSGNGQWVLYRTFSVARGETVRHEFPPAFDAYWVRCQANRPATVTAAFRYE